MPTPCVTISQVAEAAGGPFVFWDDLDTSCQRASEIGFPAVELFLPGPDFVTESELQEILSRHSLDLAAVGTGAGMVKHKLSLTGADAQMREQARDFVRRMIDFGGPFKAPAIIGSMQGRYGIDGVDQETATAWLREALSELGEHARQYGVPLIYEPLNRYETNLANTVADGVALVEPLGDANVTLLADLFHMNIEEENVADALRTGGSLVGHVHYVDSNRKAAGFGHTDFAPIAQALTEISYEGYLCAEAFPLPDPQTTAEQTLKAVREHFPS